LAVIRSWRMRRQTDVSDPGSRDAASVFACRPPKERLATSDADHNWIGLANISAN
jgi:hypothetical protein